MSKAPNGSGSVWRRPDGRYNAALTYPYHDPETGRTRRRRATTTKKTWEAAHRWLVEKQHDLLGGSPSASPEDPFLADYLRSWLADAVEPRVAPNTYLKREYAVRVHILPALGHARLSAVEPRHVQALYSRLSRAGYSLATRREVHVTLGMALKQAVRWGILSRNPCELVDAPKQGRTFAEDEEGEVRALVEGQAEAFFAATAQGNRWHHYYVVAIRTGLRPGEMLGLRWGDLSLDLDPGSLRVRRTLDTHSSPRFGPPKSEASRRTIALHWEAREAFGAQRAMLADEGLPTGPKALVFPSTKGTPMSAANLRNRHLGPDLRAAGLPRLTLHELRHTFASIALFEWRFQPDVVREMLGHESIAMTMRIYGHLFPGAQEQAIRSLRRLQKRPEGGQEKRA